MMTADKRLLRARDLCALIAQGDGGGRPAPVSIDPMLAPILGACAEQ